MTTGCGPKELPVSIVSSSHEDVHVAAKTYTWYGVIFFAPLLRVSFTVSSTMLAIKSSNALAVRPKFQIARCQCPVPLVVVALTHPAIPTHRSKPVLLVRLCPRLRRLA